MKLSDTTHFVFRPLGRWGLGLWTPPQMAEQVCGEAEARGDTTGPSRGTVLHRLLQFVKWEYRVGPWALVVLPPTRESDDV